MKKSDFDRLAWPTSSGVYLFKNSRGEVLYVGKAVNLVSRLKSYFQARGILGRRTEQMVKEAQSIETIKTETEVDALILEAVLIKKYRPHFNVDLKDDKSYQYFEITKESFPRVGLTRKTLNLQSRYFGPFPAGLKLKSLFKDLRKVFPFRDCGDTKFQRQKKLKQPCLYGEINLCPAPCQGQLPSKAYRGNPQAIREILEGKRLSVEKRLQSEMEKLSKSRHFEAAAEVRDKLSRLKYVAQKRWAASDYLKSPAFEEDVANRKLKDLLTLNLPNLSKIPTRIEAYDVSNFYGQGAASLVVFTRGLPDKSQYRRFKIRVRKDAGDTAMLKETLSRRLHQSWPLPDLILIDGGRPQVSIAASVLALNSVTIPLVGLAKKREQLVIKDKGRGYLEISLPPASPALNILKQIRDESHRFALAYHRLLRKQKLL